MAFARVTVGKKLTPAAQKKVDPKTIARTRATSGGTGPTGQALQDSLLICPYCGAGNWIVQDSTTLNHYVCWNCYGVGGAGGGGSAVA